MWKFTRIGNFAHGADFAVRGIGTTKAEAFEQAAVALTGVLTDPLRVFLESKVVIEIEADREARLVEWLNAPPPGARRSTSRGRSRLSRSKARPIPVSLSVRTPVALG